MWRNQCVLFLMPTRKQNGAMAKYLNQVIHPHRMKALSHLKAFRPYWTTLRGFSLSVKKK